MNSKHTPVLLNEVLKGLNPLMGDVYLDMTLGFGGHGKEIASCIGNEGTFIGIDQDQFALSEAKKEIQKIANKRQIFEKCNFNDFERVLDENEIKGVDVMLFDLGLNSFQIDNSNRGFSYMKDGDLDMRMDMNNKLTAFDVINDYDEKSLSNLFRDYGEEKFHNQIAKAIVKQRQIKPIKTTKELLSIVENAVPKKFLQKGFKHAKRIFQAIRIEVNEELAILEKTLDKVIDRVNTGGRIGIISFHSLEDKIVKNFFMSMEDPCTCPKNMPCVCGKKPLLKRINKKAVTASNDEQIRNTRSKSAKLRMAVRI